jgi:hypothetical protein
MEGTPPMTNNRTHILWLAVTATASLLLFGCPPPSIGDTGDDDAGDDDAGDDDAGDDDAGDDDMGDDDMGDDDSGDDDAGDDDTEIPMEIPPLSGVTCNDTETNDCLLDDSIEKWSACAQTCSGALSPDGDADLFSGTLATVDNDTYGMTVGADGYVNAILQWDDPQGDLDFYFFCYYGDDENPLNWYVLISDTTSVTIPEQGTSVIPLPAGTPCFIWVAGYVAGDGEPYTLHLWTSEA